MTTDNDIIKMSVICNIQTIEKALEYMNPTSFEALWKTDYESLRKIQDKLVINYNDVIEARRFAADMLYKR